MKPKKTDLLSSRTILDRIGISSDANFDLLEADDPFESPMESLARALSERYEAMQVCHTFKAGDIVTWKSGLSNRRYPKNGKPAVVMAVLEGPVLDCERDSGSPYFREPLDVVLGVFAEEEGMPALFLTWHFDSRRFQPWRAEEEK